MTIGRLSRSIALLAAFLAVFAVCGADSRSAPAFRFAILGDRTGEAQPGVYEEAWREASAAHPAFVVTTGDTIEGGDDATAAGEWQQAERIQAPYNWLPVYLVPGNHDIWSEASEALFRRYAGHPPHYSFDHDGAHFTILDNSRTDELTDSELKFLTEDLRTHAAQPVKFVFSHRPSWLLNAMLENPRFPLHQLALKYGVRYVIAGHVHQILHGDLDGVMYLSMPSSGGHLRNSREYEDGWFFAYTMVEVRGGEVRFTIHELKPPYGKGRVTEPKDWGKAGLAVAAPAGAVPRDRAGRPRPAGTCGGKGLRAGEGARPTSSCLSCDRSAPALPPVSSAA